MALFRQKSSSSKSVVESAPSGIPSPSAANVPGSSDGQIVNSPQRPASIRERTASFTNRIRTSSTSSLNKLKRSASSASVSPSTIGHADGPPISPSAGSSSSERKSRRISLSKIFSGSSGNSRGSEKTEGEYASQEEFSPDSPSRASNVGLSKSMSFGSLRSRKEARTLHRSSHQPQKQSQTSSTPEALPPQLSRSVTPPGQSPDPSLPRSAHTGIPSPASRRAITPVHTPTQTSALSSAVSSPSKIPRRIRVSSNPPLSPQVDTTVSPVRARASTSRVVTPDHQQNQPQVSKGSVPIASSSSSRSLSRASQAPSFLLEDPFSTPPPPEVVQPSTSSATAVSPSSSPSTAFDLLQTIQRERSNKSANTTSTNGERTSSNLKRSNSQAESILGGVLEREVEGEGRVSRSPSATRRRRLTGDMMRPREVSLGAKAESLNSPDMRSQAGGSSGVDSMVLTPESPRSQHSPVAFGEDSFLARGAQEALGSPLREPAQRSTFLPSPPSSTTPDKIPIPLTNELLEALKLGRVMVYPSSFPETEFTERNISAAEIEPEEFKAEKSAPDHPSEHAILHEALPSDEPTNAFGTPAVESRSHVIDALSPGANGNINHEEEDDIRENSPSGSLELGSDLEHSNAAGRLEQAGQVQNEPGISQDDDHSVTPTTAERSSMVSSPRLSYISEESSNAAVDVGGDDDSNQDGEGEDIIDTEYIRETLKSFPSRQPTYSRALNENPSSTPETFERQKNIGNEENDHTSTARNDHEDPSTALDPSASMPPTHISNPIIKSSLDGPKPTLVSVVEPSKEVPRHPEITHQSLSSAQHDNRFETAPSSSISAESPSVNESSTTFDDRVKHIKKEQPIDEKLGNERPLDALPSSIGGAESNLPESREDNVLQGLTEEEKEKERTPVGSLGKSPLVDDSSQGQSGMVETGYEAASGLSESDDKPEKVGDGLQTTLAKTEQTSSPSTLYTPESPPSIIPADTTEDPHTDKRNVPGSPILPRNLLLRVAEPSNTFTHHLNLDQTPASMNTAIHPSGEQIQSLDLSETPSHPTPVVSISSGLTPQSSPKVIQEGMYDLDEPSSPLTIAEDQMTGPVESRPRLTVNPSSNSPDAIILHPDVSSATVGGISTSPVMKSVSTTPTSEREGKAISEGASASIAEQTLKQVLDPKRVLIKDETGELTPHEAQSANKDRDVENSEKYQDGFPLGTSDAQIKHEGPSSSEPLKEDSSEDTSPPHLNSVAPHHEEQSYMAVSSSKDNPVYSFEQEHGQDDKRSSADPPPSTVPILKDTLLEAVEETKDESPEYLPNIPQATIEPSTSKVQPQPIEGDTISVSEQPQPIKVTTTPSIDSPMPIVAAGKSSIPRPKLPVRVLTTPTRPSTPQRPQFSRAITTNSINTFELPNPFASLLNSQRFFIRIPISLLPTRLASFAQKSSFSIPSFFPGAVDPSEGSRSRSHSPDSVQTISCASNANSGANTGSGFGSGLESGKALLGTAAGIVGTSVKWGFGWPVLVPLRAGQYVLSTLGSHAGLGTGPAVKEKDRSAIMVTES